MLKDIGEIVRGASGATPDASGAIPNEGLFETQTKYKGQAPDTTTEEEQDYGYAPPSGQQQVGSATYTNEDFYPGPADPAQFAFREGLQVVARPGRMPMGAIAKAAASIERKRQQTKQAKDQLYSLTQKRFEGVDPNRRKLIYQMQDREIDNKMREYYLAGEKQPLEGKSARTDKRVQRIEKKIEDLEAKGDEKDDDTIKQLKSKKTRLEGKQRGIQGEIALLGDEAYVAAKSNPREMDKLWAKAAKDPVFRSKLMETVRMNEATDYHYNYVYNSAKKYIEDVDDPKKSILKDPFLYNSAWKIVNPGPDATIEQLANAETEYNRAWELNAYFKSEILPTAEKVAADWDAEVKDKGQYYQLTESNKWQNFVDAQKDALLSDAPESVRVWYNSKNNKKAENEPSEDQMDQAAKDILNGFLGEVVKKSISQKPVREYRAPSGDGPKSGLGTPAVSLRRGYSIPGGYTTDVPDQIVISPTEITGGKKNLVDYYQISPDSSSSKENVSTPELTWNQSKGIWRIIGRELSREVLDKIETKIRAISDEEKRQEEKTRLIAQEIKNSPPKNYPIESNADFLLNKYGSADPYEILAQSLAARGINYDANTLREGFRKNEFIGEVMNSLRIPDRPGGGRPRTGPVASPTPASNEETYDPATGTFK